MNETENREMKTGKTIELGELTNELTYRRYIMNKDRAHDLFQKMTVSEYIALYTIEQEQKKSSIYSGRTYLKELSEKMELTIRQTSRMVGELKDRGLVLWSHDGDGSEGTYVTMTESGEKALKEQEQILKQFYGKVIKKFGMEHLVDLLNLMKQLDTVMSSELEDLEEKEGEE